MIARLSDELQQAIDAQQGQPVELEHPVTLKKYVLVDQSTHERAMKALERQNVHQAIQAGIDSLEAGHGKPIAAADKQLCEKLGFPEK